MEQLEALGGALLAVPLLNSLAAAATSTDGLAAQALASSMLAGLIWTIQLVSVRPFTLTPATSQPLVTRWLWRRA